MSEEEASKYIVSEEEAQRLIAAREWALDAAQAHLGPIPTFDVDEGLRILHDPRMGFSNEAWEKEQQKKQRQLQAQRQAQNNTLWTNRQYQDDGPEL